MSTATVITPETLRKHAKALQDISDKMEATGNPDWFPIAQATVVLDSRPCKMPETLANRRFVTEIHPVKSPRI